MDTILTLDELPKHLCSIPNAIWGKLFNLIPRIEQVDPINGWITNNEGFSIVEETSELFGVFYKLVYEIGLVINFDWRKWDEADDIIHNMNIDYEQLSPVTLCKLLTYHV